MRIPNINCQFYASSGSCVHPDCGRWLFNKSCILHDQFVGSCKKQIKYEKPPPPPPPPPKKAITEMLKYCG